jgi:hypothetical protein
MTAQKKLFTCVSKGGEYELVGTSFGAGPRKGEPLIVYRDTATGKLHHREPENFMVRMKPIAQPQNVNVELLAALEPFAQLYAAWDGSAAPTHFGGVLTPELFKKAQEAFEKAAAQAAHGTAKGSM